MTRYAGEQPQTGETWTVVEVQRDIAWAEAPASVRQAAGQVEPVRVIESRQTDGAIVYELFAAGKPQTPSLEVMLKDGRVLAAGTPAEVLTPARIRELYDVEAEVARHARTGHLTVTPISPSQP